MYERGLRELKWVQRFALFSENGFWVMRTGNYKGRSPEIVHNYPRLHIFDIYKSLIVKTFALVIKQRSRDKSSKYRHRVL